MSIAIIGGGFTGLMSAFLLERILGADTDIVIFERSNRLGGRICTCGLDGRQAYYDSGAAELYEIAGGYSLKAIARAFGLQTRDMVATPFFHFAGRLLKCEDDFDELMGPEGKRALASFWKLGTSLRTPAQYAMAGHPSDNAHPWLRQTFSQTLRLVDDPIARRFTKIQAHSDVAAEPDLTSGLFGFDNLLIDHPEYVQMFTLVGGNERLIRALEERVSARILLNSRVDGVMANRSGPYEVVYTSEHTRRFQADFVLVTLPPLTLDEISWNPAPLAEAIRAHARHHRYPADYLRATLSTQERVWAEELPEDYFVCEGLGGVTVYDKTVTSERETVPILSLLIAGEHARSLAQCSDREILDRVLQALPPEACVDVKSIVTFTADRWTGEVGVSRLPGGVPLLPFSQRHCPSQEYPGIFMLGDYLYDTTINGALDACVFVTTSVSNVLTDRRVDSIEEFLNNDGFLQTAAIDGKSNRQPGRDLPFLTAR